MEQHRHAQRGGTFIKRKIFQCGIRFFRTVRFQSEKTLFFQAVNIIRRPAQIEVTEGDEEAGEIFCRLQDFRFGGKWMGGQFTAADIHQPDLLQPSGCRDLVKTAGIPAEMRMCINDHIIASNNGCRGGRGRAVSRDNIIAVIPDMSDRIIITGNTQRGNSQHGIGPVHVSVFITGH